MSANKKKRSVSIFSPLFGGSFGREQRERYFVMTRSGGNISLQNGNYITDDEYRQRRDRVLRHTFASKF